MLVEIEKQAFENLVKKVDEMHEGWLDNLKRKSPQSDWVNGQTVLKALGISKRTLQTMRSTGKIEYTMVSPKLIYYSSKSLEKLLNKNVYKPFNQ